MQDSELASLGFISSALDTEPWACPCEAVDLGQGTSLRLINCESWNMPEFTVWASQQAISAQMGYTHLLAQIHKTGPRVSCC